MVLATMNNHKTHLLCDLCPLEVTVNTDLFVENSKIQFVVIVFVGYTPLHAMCTQFVRRMWRNSFKTEINERS